MKRMPFGVWTLALAVCGLSACSGPPEATPTPYRVSAGDVHFVMLDVLDPAADKIWDSAGTIITEAGSRELHPTTDEGWAEVRHAAAVVTESANLLMLPGRGRDANWIEISGGLADTGKTLMDAADAQDPQAVFDAGGTLYNVCVACHQIYVVAEGEGAP